MIHRKLVKRPIQIVPIFHCYVRRMASNSVFRIIVFQLMFPLDTCPVFSLVKQKFDKKYIRLKIIDLFSGKVRHHGSQASFYLVIDWLLLCR